MLIGKARLAELLPHAGAMCLLDGVLAWDGARIHCTASSHRAPNNPLRHNSRLGILCGVEYAAQAVALHCALMAGDAAQSDARHRRAGYLASLRAVTCHADRLDLLPGPLNVEAERLHADASRAIYHFRLRHEERILLDGRGAVAQIVA